MNKSVRRGERQANRERDPETKRGMERKEEERQFLGTNPQPGAPDPVALGFYVILFVMKSQTGALSAEVTPQEMLMAASLQDPWHSTHFITTATLIF